MNTPVNFELAKLLKEKGFEQNIEVGVICRVQNKTNKYYEETRPLNKSDLLNQWAILNEVYPTIAEVVMWLYEKYGVWVYCGEIKKDKFYFKAKQMKSNWRRVVFGTNDNQNALYSTPTEAYEAAIKYVLENLLGNEKNI